MHLRLFPRSVSSAKGQKISLFDSLHFIGSLDLASVVRHRWIHADGGVESVAIVKLEAWNLEVKYVEKSCFVKDLSTYEGRRIRYFISLYALRAEQVRNSRRLRNARDRSRARSAPSRPPAAC